MLCPEGSQLDSETHRKEEKRMHSPSKRNLVEGTGRGSVELGSYKSPKTWKKSITNFFRNQLRSTKSNDGDHPSDSKDHFEDKEMSTEQKWQSLGKIFRRQSVAEQWNRSLNQEGESSSQNKRLAVRKVLSSYFGKNQKTLSVLNDK